MRMHMRPRTARYLVVSSFFTVSPAPFMSDAACQEAQFDQPPLLLISVYICSWCLFKAYMFSELWYKMPLNSSPLVDKQVHNGSPSRSDPRNLNVLFTVAVCHVFCSRRPKRETLYFLLHSQQFKERFVSFVLRNHYFVVFWDEVTKLFKIIFLPQRFCVTSFLFILLFLMLCLLE